MARGSIHASDDVCRWLGRQWTIDGPVALLIGMEVQFGRTAMTCTDAYGALPVLASTPSELSAKASARYGSHRLAADFLKRSHTTVIRHSKRYKARMLLRQEAEKSDDSAD